MTQTSAGYDGGPYFFEGEWADVLGAMMTSGPVPDSSTNLQVFNDAGGRQIKVRAGNAVMRGHAYYSDATETRALAPNPGSQARIDLVILRLDTARKTTTIEIVQGTAGPTPARHALTRQPGGVWEEPLAAVTLAGDYTAVSGGNISDERTWAISGAVAGDLKPWGTGTPPLGWKVCDGTELRRDAYPRLFATLGTEWGTPSGSLVFKLPDFRNRMMMGSDTNDNVGVYAGTDDFAVDESHFAAHKHAVDGDYGNRYVVTAASSSLYLAASGPQAVSFSDTDPAGGSNAINWRPPHGKVHVIIRAL